MPLIGYIDPSHWERMHDKDGRLPNWLDLDELMVALMEPNPKFSPWTFELAKAVVDEHYERKDRISSTTLVTACPRAEVIQRKEDYIDSLDESYLMLRGTMVHRTLESYPRLGSVAEVKFATTIDDIPVSAMPDLLTTDTIYDYKVTDNPPGFGYPYRHHTEQLQFNAFVVRHAESWTQRNADNTGWEPATLPFDPHEIALKHAVIVYLGPRGPKIIEVQRKQDFITPAGVHKTAKRPYIWSDDEVLTEFRPRLHIMKAALESYPEWPDPVTVEIPGEGMKTFTAQDVWGGDEGWTCPGPPLCNLKTCIARRQPGRYAWPKRCRECKGGGKKGRGVCSRCKGSGEEPTNARPTANAGGRRRTSA